MNNEAFGIICLIGLILNLLMLPNQIAERQSFGAMANVIGAIFGAIGTVYFFMK
jgi:hypothetical protein